MSAPATKLRIATRESRLAMRQTEIVAAAIGERHAGLMIEIVGMTTRGDRVLDRPLAEVGGKGLFVKELEVALEEDRADIAVHSLKDVPMELPEGFALASFGRREDPFDAFVSNRFASLAALPEGAVVGTSSLRRECQLRRLRPRLEPRLLRGNVNTRLARLDAGDFDAIILAAAGLRRLGFAERIRHIIPAAQSLPAIGQGILAIEYRSGRDDLRALLAAFEDRATACAARAERALGRVVEGSCEVPVGALASVRGETLELDAFVGMPDGTRMVRKSASGACAQAERVGHALGEALLAAGARDILRALQASHA
jgi:hydroxymethylbilane synthase